MNERDSLFPFRRLRRWFMDDVLTDTQALLVGDFLQRWFPYRLWEYDPATRTHTGPRWQWPDILGRLLR